MLVGLIQIQKCLPEPQNANLTVKNDVFQKKPGGERVNSHFIWRILENVLNGWKEREPHRAGGGGGGGTQTCVFLILHSGRGGIDPLKVFPT